MLQVARNILAKGLGLTVRRSTGVHTAESRLTNARATFQVWMREGACHRTTTGVGMGQWEIDPIHPIHIQYEMKEI